MTNDVSCNIKMSYRTSCYGATSQLGNYVRLQCSRHKVICYKGYPGPYAQPFYQNNANKHCYFVHDNYGKLENTDCYSKQILLC